MDNKVSQQINDIVGDNVKKIAQLFPSAVKDGEVDFEALKEELGEFREVDSEKYELTWAGKKNAKKIAQEEVFGRTLKFIPEDSKDIDTTENLYIEGDNLEVLKLLRQNYYGAVKMIYIDPPYNTGNDFVYMDNFVSAKEESDMSEGHFDEEGNRLVVNNRSQNRFHANWLSMMYPRLKIAKDMLTDDGVMFISIDRNEHANLKEICDEIFGVDCFMADMVWKSSDNSNNNALTFSEDHNNILVYAKSSQWKPHFLNDPKKRAHFKNPDNDPKGPWFDGNPVNNPGLRVNLQYDITTPNGKIIKHPANGWRWSWETVQEKLKTGELRFSEDETRLIRRTYLSDMKGLPPSTLCVDLDVTGHTRKAKYELKNLFPEVPVTSLFSTPKPSLLIRYLLTLASEHDSIIMDFFSGSATTADAVMQQNIEDGGKRRWILVQISEMCDDSNEFFQSICDMGTERIRRAGDRIKQEHPDADIDIGFKVFRTADTNIKWNSLMDLGQIDISQLEYTPDLLDFMPDAKDIDIVYELMLRQRDVALSEKMEQLSDIGDRTYLYASSYLVCLETEITENLVSKLAELDPLPIKFIFRDSAFKDDIALKDETFRRLKALIEKNAGTNKPTYTVEFI